MRMNKTEFFKTMRSQPVSANAFIDVSGMSVRLNNPRNPNAGISSHRTVEAAERAVTKYAAWLEEFREIEEAHAEALEMNEALIVSASSEGVQTTEALTNEKGEEVRTEYFGGLLAGQRFYFYNRQYEKAREMHLAINLKTGELEPFDSGDVVQIA